MHPLAIEASISSAETAAANRWLGLWPAALLLVLSAWILPLHAASITVNTATDDFGAVSSNCSLREAIQSANNNADFGGCVSSGIYNPVITDVINLPQLGAGGSFTLTRIGTDDNNVSGDLDINGNVRIEGFSATNSVIRGDTTDPDSDRHRLMQVMAGTVTLNDLALQNGLEDGTTAGGGLRTEPGSTTILNRVTVAFNTAAGNAGGILNRGTMTINASLISQNKTTNAANGGGGIFNSAGATLTINDSRILSNTVDGGAQSFGGGIYSGGTLNLDNTVVDGNLADGRQAVGDVLASGGGIHAVGDLTAVQSTISNNQAVSGNGVSRGGGIHIEGGNATLALMAIVSNRAADEDFGGIGGGLAARGLGVEFEIRDSVISNNVVSGGSALSGRPRGGGIFLSAEFGRVLRSTIANNRALDEGDGGGASICNGSQLVNSTVIGNSAENDGGGVYVAQCLPTLVSKIRSTTIAGNIGNSDNGVGAGTGGLHFDDGQLEMGHTVIAENIDRGAEADCGGETILSVGHNLVQGGCVLAGGSGDRTQNPAQLAPATNNGGPLAGSSLGITSGMLTRAPMAGSLLIDSGNSAGCKDPDNVVLSTDQIGRTRPNDGDLNGSSVCDRGAVEFINTDVIFRNGFQ